MCESLSLLLLTGCLTPQIEKSIDWYGISKQKDSFATPFFDLFKKIIKKKKPLQGPKLDISQYCQVSNTII